MIIAGTGHRPQFCPCGFNENHPWLLTLKSKISESLGELGPSIVISGMAIGYDTWLAESALALNIPLHAYVPFQGQGLKWPTESYKKYQSILDKASKVLYTSESYAKDVFFIRDKAMVDACTNVLALWNPEKKSGGTYYTLQYAETRHRNIRNLWF